MPSEFFLVRSLWKCTASSLALLVVLGLSHARAAEANGEPERISLRSEQNPESKGTITVHLADKGNGAAVVICPGGGYGGLVTGAEGHGIASWLNDHGIAGIVLEYELPSGRPFVPLRDAQRAIRITRSQAQAWKLDPTRIGIMGFSAGGHLASTAGTHFDAGSPQAEDPIDRASCRPDFMILIYPVISMGELTHGGSKRNLLGTEPTAENVKLFSNEIQVTKDTPPTFLAHAADDRVVVPENSRAMYQALQAHGVTSKYLELPRGGHGLNGYQGPMWDAWQNESLAWLRAELELP
ncbi:MAG: alpha/beta hydrolase [Planctomycetales bacterium]|nr:alpha/beta hydrolase [Planctomycetales bacterium]